MKPSTILPEGWEPGGSTEFCCYVWKEGNQIWYGGIFSAARFRRYVKQDVKRGAQYLIRVKLKQGEQNVEKQL